jgi:hypothetical protein
VLLSNCALGFNLRPYIKALAAPDSVETRRMEYRLLAVLSVFSGACALAVVTDEQCSPRHRIPFKRVRNVFDDVASTIH